MAAVSAVRELIKQGGGCHRYESLYTIAGMTRQGYHQGRAKECRRVEESLMVMTEVRRVRRELPRTGVRKLWKELPERFKELGLKIGRNRLFAIVGEAGGLIKAKQRYVRTTDSRHGFAKVRNELVGLAIIRANQVWVSDITYIQTREGFVYASLITDAHSRKIIGYDVSRSLSIEGSMRALGAAIGQCTSCAGVIHHSDRGVQYCSTSYRQRLSGEGMIASMASAGNPYENAIAERVNGILKQEFGMDETFATLLTTQRALREAVRLYNTRRRHTSLQYCMPADVHDESLSLNTLHSTYNPVNL